MKNNAEFDAGTEALYKTHDAKAETKLFNPERFVVAFNLLIESVRQNCS